MKEKEAKKIMKDLQEDYNLVSSSFANSRNRLWPEMKFLFDYAKEGEDVLDLGCGNGRFCEYLKETNYRGIDFSENMIKEAKKRYPRNKFLIGNALSLPFKDSSFNKVYSIAVIHQIPLEKYREEAILEIKRVLRPKGMAFITVWDFGKENRFFYIKNILLNTFSKTFLGPRDLFLKRKRYYYIFKKGELSRIFKKAGFRVVEEGTTKKEKRSNYYIIAEKE